MWVLTSNTLLSRLMGNGWIKLYYTLWNVYLHSALFRQAAVIIWCHIWPNNSLIYCFPCFTWVRYQVPFDLKGWITENLWQSHVDFRRLPHLMKQGSYALWKSWNVFNFCNDKFQAWKVLENERKSWKTPGKIKQLDKPLYLQKITHSLVLLVQFGKLYQAFFLRNVQIQQLLYTYRTIKVCLLLVCIYRHNVCPGKN